MCAMFTRSVTLPDPQVRGDETLSEAECCRRRWQHNINEADMRGGCASKQQRQGPPVHSKQHESECGLPLRHLF